MKVGICIVTCDRPNYLRSTLASLEGERVDWKVIIDNGESTHPEVQEIANRHKCAVIDGNCGNSPQGQNLGLIYFASKGCDVVLKSDDDIRYGRGYVSKLIRVFMLHQTDAGAVGGVCWSKDTADMIHQVGAVWRGSKGAEISGESIGRYRFFKSKVIKMKHLHGSYLYDVKFAMDLAKRTKEIRGGGAFPGYLSKVAFREETEFTYLLWKLMRRNLYLVTDAVSFHHYAPGGIRKCGEDVGPLMDSDNELVKEKLKQMGVEWDINPAWIEVGDE